MKSERVIFHTDRGSTYTANAFTKLCRQLGIRQSMGRVGSCFDNAAAEAFFSTLEWEVLSRHRLPRHPTMPRPSSSTGATSFYNHQRRHSTAGMMSARSTTRTPRPPSRKRHRKPSTSAKSGGSPAYPR